MKHKVGELQSYCDQWFKATFPNKYKDFSRLEYAKKYKTYQVLWDDRTAGKRQIRKQNRGRYVWERFNGEIPKDYQVRHVNGDTEDDRLENLELLKKSELLKKVRREENYRKKRRIFIDKGNGLIEHKRCTKCKEYYPVEHYWKLRGYLRPTCRKCFYLEKKNRGDAKKYYWENVEKVRAYHREWYQRNKDKINAKRREERDVKK